MIWDAMIAWYLFLAGLGAGAFVLGALAGWVKQPAVHMRKIGFIIAPVAVTVGTLLLLFDAKAGFENPMRLFYLVTNLSSVMAWGVIILSAFLVVSIASLIVLLLKKKTPKALDVVGIVLAVAVAAYTGVLLGDASSAFPMWNPFVLPLLFVVSAASTGCASVLIGVWFKAPEEVAKVSFLKKSGLILPIVEIILVAILIGATASVQGSAAAAASTSISNLVSGSHAILFWIGFVVIGILSPFCVEVYHMTQRKKNDAAVVLNAPDSNAAALPGQAKALGIVSGMGVLIGGFLLRYLVIMAAVPMVFS